MFKIGDRVRVQFHDVGEFSGDFVRATTGRVGTVVDQKCDGRYIVLMDEVINLPHMQLGVLGLRYRDLAAYVPQEGGVT